MFLELRNLKDEPDFPSQLTIQQVTEGEPLLQSLRIWENGSPEEVIEIWFRLYSGLQLTDSHPLRLYLGLLDGQPVATSSVFFAAGVTCIGFVSTLPAYRRQGLGKAMTLKALNTARESGYRIATLTASPMGAAIYRRLGFRECGTFSTYLWHPR